MSDNPEPGFYDDPEDPLQQRWWDGDQWTDTRQPRPPTQTAQGPGGGSTPGWKPWYEKRSSWIAVGVVVLLGFGALVGELDDSGDAESSPVAAESDDATVDDEPTGLVPEPESAVGSEPEREPGTAADVEPEPATDMTRSQENAVASARNYLSFSSFSRAGLIEQLKFDQFSTEDATFAVDALEVDWKDQAAATAENYLSFSPFSESGLVEQLEFDGFTADEAAAGVGAVEADWNEQAALAAEQYLSFSSFSRDALIDQLVFDGFTREQAEYGVDQAGL